MLRGLGPFQSRSGAPSSPGREKHGKLPPALQSGHPRGSSVWVKSTNVSRTSLRASNPWTGRSEAQEQPVFLPSQRDNSQSRAISPPPFLWSSQACYLESQLNLLPPLWQPQCTTMQDRKDVWIYLFVYCIDNLIKGYSNYFYISMKNLRSDINVEINTPREH